MVDWPVAKERPSKWSKHTLEVPDWTKNFRSYIKFSFKYVMSLSIACGIIRTRDSLRSVSFPYIELSGSRWREAIIHLNNSRWRERVMKASGGQWNSGAGVVKGLPNIRETGEVWQMWLSGKIGTWQVPITVPYFRQAYRFYKVEINILTILEVYNEGKWKMKYEKVGGPIFT